MADLFERMHQEELALLKQLSGKTVTTATYDEQSNIDLKLSDGTAFKLTNNCYGGVSIETIMAEPKTRKNSKRKRKTSRK
jgi:hypothetical protein